MAKEKGLTPLAELIKAKNQPQTNNFSLEKEAQKYLNDEVKTIEEAIAGAGDILAEEIGEKANLRAYLREFILKNGWFTSSVKKRL